MEKINNEQHEHLEHLLLTIRNIAVAISFILFVSSVFGAPNPFLLKAIAYFFGMIAYATEIALLTDGFKKKMPLKEMFMPYLFAPMYLMLGISYLIEFLE